MVRKTSILIFPIILFVLSILVFFDDNVADAAKSLEITNQIILQDRNVSSILVNPNTNKIYVSHSKSCSPVSSITVIDGLSEIIDTEIALPPSEGNLDFCFQISRHSIALNPETNMIYAIASRSSVFSINATTNSFAQIEIENPSYRGSIVVNPNTNLVYLSDSLNSIKVINGSTNKEVTTINIDDTDISNTLNYQKSTPIIRILDNNYQHQSKNLVGDFQNRENEIEPLQNSGGKLIKIASPVEPPPRLAINPDLNKLYAGKADSSGLYIIDLTTNEVINNISELEEIGHVQVDQVTNKVYVAHSIGISVIDGYEDQVIDTFQLGYFNSMTTNKITKISYRVSGDQNLIAFDPSTNEVLDTISLKGMKPYLMALNENTNNIYITTGEGLIVLDGLDEGGIPPILPPKQQMRNGTLPQDVVCKPELELIFKSSNSYPTCVKPSSVDVLFERGWAHLFFISNLKIFDLNRDVLDTVVSGEQSIFEIDMQNRINKKYPFSLLLTVENRTSISDNSFEERWVIATMKPNSISNFEIGWESCFPGQYSITIDIIDNIENRLIMSNQEKKVISVVGEPVPDCNENPEVTYIYN